MGFKRKQMLGFGLILLFLAIFLSFMVFTLNNLKGSMTEIVEDRYYKVSAAMEIRQLFTSQTVKFYLRQMRPTRQKERKALKSSMKTTA